MARHTWALLAVLLLAVPGLARAADPEPLAGNWRVNLQTAEKPTYWLLKFESENGKWQGHVLDVAEGIPPSEIEDVSVSGDRLRFTLVMKGKRGTNTASFDGTFPKEAGKPIRGSLELDQLVPTVLEPTTWKKLSTLDLNKEIVARQGNDLPFVQASLELLRDAAKNKAKPEEVRSWADKLNKVADAFGPRYQREIALRSVRYLVEQEGLEEVALTYARRAERMLDPKDPPGDQLRVLNALANALDKTGKQDERKEIEARLDKIDVSVKPEPFGGRKAKSDRVVLIELFTGAQCPPCVAADLAFDAVAKSYKPDEVVLLQYHLHVPGPDPLANPDTDARKEYYGDAYDGTPTILFNGSPLDGGGGSFDDAPMIYKQFRRILDPMLEKPAKAKLTATAARKGDKINVTAEASEIEDASQPLKLRVVLFEEEIRYTGGNQMRKHHHVVRGFPGGVAGVAVKNHGAKQTATVDVAELRTNLTKYLADFEKEDPDNKFPNAQRPLEMKNLKVVAFVQNDRTKEVLQAVQVDVSGGQ